MCDAHESYREGDAAFTPRFDLGEFRYFAAGYVKLLIRARRKADPDFFSGEEIGRWGVDDQADLDYPAYRLLKDAADRLGYLNSYFVPRCGSGGVAPADQSTAIGRLIGNLAFLVAADGGGPYHNAELIRAAEQLERGESIDWNELVRWEDLPQIRVDLDRLPHPAHREDNRTIPVCPVVIRNDRNREVLVHGRLTTLTVPGFHVISVLLEHFPLGLSKDNLARLSGHDDAVGILRRLAKKDLWRDAIVFPGTPGAGGYRLRRQA